MEKQKVGEDGETIDNGEFKDTVDSIYGILFTIGVVLTVIVGAVLGIKFMLGSVDEQAKIKEILVSYIVGCIVIFGAFGIWKIMVTLLSNISKT